ncbi:hypothetical protein AB6A40_009437 [Gnathostoma spinigerum]|uniref:Fatty acid amide hydrolase n=1 Tax=Gnathostoma spinigerum TaxID=75299 RepID=A0ABD6ESD7_9BILA
MSLFNILDFAAGTVCVTYLTAGDERNLVRYPDSNPWHRLAKKIMKNAVGLPIGVQVAVPPFKEETALRILSELDGSSPSDFVRLEDINESSEA